MNCDYMTSTHTYRDTEMNSNIIPYEFLYKKYLEQLLF
jgi:hypothetical protein